MAVVDIGLKPDIPKAIEFLQSWCGCYDVVLSASHTDPMTGAKGRFETKVFPAPVDWSTLGKWIAVRQGDRAWANIYFSVNPVLSGTTNKKTARSDIAAMVALHVDCDVNPGENQVDGIKRIIKVLEAYPNPPTDIVVSGGGAQGYWRFAAPIPIEGDVAVAEDLKLYNIQLERDLNGDHCHNVDRIMRVPGTVNIPKDDKIKKGRKPALAYWYGSNDRRYSTGDFKKAPPPDVAKTAKYEKGFQDSGSYEAKVLPTDERLAKVDRKWIDLGLTGLDPDRKYAEPGGKVDRSRRALAFCTALLRAGVDPQLVASILMDPTWVAGDCVRDKAGETQRQLKRLIQRAGKFVGEDMEKPVTLREGHWDEIAEKFFLRADKGNWQYFLHYRGECIIWRRGCYIIIEKDTVHSVIWKFLSAAMIRKQVDDVWVEEPFSPNSNDVTEVFNAICRARHMDGEEQEPPPCWINEARYDPAGPPALECISVGNGILHVPTRQMYEHTEDLFSLNKVDVNYEPEAQCPLWHKTLGQWWPDEGAKEPLLLQEILGLFLTPMTKLQKLFFFIGPGRSGKGTISKIIKALIGKRNCCAPTLDSLASDFGLQSLVGKTLAIIGEAKFGRSVDTTKATNILKSISGEDGIDINRKNAAFLIDTQLLVRVLSLCNEMPQFRDNSPALVNRVIALKMNISYAGKEDESLLGRLCEELPGIMNWAIEGFDRLRANGWKFTMPDSAIEQREAMGRVASPVAAFLEDCTERDDEAVVSEDALFAAFSKWCELNSQKVWSKVNFIDGVMAQDQQHFKRVRTGKGGRDEKRERLRSIKGLVLKGGYERAQAHANEKRGDESKAHADAEIPF